MSITEIKTEGKNKKKLVDEGYALAKKLYETVRTERDKSGYRENMGYDQMPKLKEKIAPLLNESFKDYYDILRFYNGLCDNL